MITDASKTERNTAGALISCTFWGMFFENERKETSGSISAEAVEGGDGSLQGDAGRKALETAKSNAAANPSMSDEAKGKSEKVAVDAKAGLVADDAAGAVQDAGSSAGQSGQDVPSGGALLPPF